MSSPCARPKPAFRTRTAEKSTLNVGSGKRMLSCRSLVVRVASTSRTNEDYYCTGACVGARAAHRLKKMRLRQLPAAYVHVYAARALRMWRGEVGTSFLEDRFRLKFTSFLPECEGAKKPRWVFLQADIKKIFSKDTVNMDTVLYRQ